MIALQVTLKSSPVAPEGYPDYHHAPNMHSHGVVSLRGTQDDSDVVGYMKKKYLLELSESLSASRLPVTTPNYEDPRRKIRAERHQKRTITPRSTIQDLLGPGLGPCKCQHNTNEKSSDECIGASEEIVSFADYLLENMLLCLCFESVREFKGSKAWGTHLWE